MGTEALLQESLSEVQAELFWTVLDILPMGVVAVNVEGKILFSNPAAEEILGKKGGRDGQTTDSAIIYGWYLPDETTLLSADHLPLVRTLDGERVSDELFWVRSTSRPAGVWIRVNGTPIRGSDGEINGAVIVFLDVTQRLQSLETNLLLSHVVEQIADGVLLTDKQGTIEYVNSAFQSITGFSHDEVWGKTPRILRSGQHPPGFYRDLWNQLLEGRPFLGTIINRKKNGELYHAEETITPIKDERGNITHFVSVMNDVSQQLLKQEQEVQLRLAHQVQQQFYRQAPNLPGFDIAGTAYPAYETSGDYFDFIPMPHGSLCIAIGDVEGHGFGSALVMALTRAYVRSFAALGLEVEQILTQVNRMLVQDLGDGFFVTLSLASLDVRNHSLVYAGAGHVPGYVISETGEVERTLESSGLPLGLFPDIRYSRACACPLRQGQIVVLWTDGVTESSGPGGTELGAGRALECVREHRTEAASAIVDRLYRTARGFAAGGVQSDDITCVILKVQPPGGTT